jgi:hypothetical protein
MYCIVFGFNCVFKSVYLFLEHRIYATMGQEATVTLVSALNGLHLCLFAFFIVFIRRRASHLRHSRTLLHVYSDTLHTQTHKHTHTHSYTQPIHHLDANDVDLDNYLTPWLAVAAVVDGVSDNNNNDNNNKNANRNIDDAAATATAASDRAFSGIGGGGGGGAGGGNKGGNGSTNDNDIVAAAAAVARRHGVSGGIYVGGGVVEVVR